MWWGSPWLLRWWFHHHLRLGRQDKKKRLCFLHKKAHLCYSIVQSSKVSDVCVYSASVGCLVGGAVMLHGFIDTVMSWWCHLTCFITLSYKLRDLLESFSDLWTAWCVQGICVHVSTVIKYFFITSFHIRGGVDGKQGEREKGLRKELGGTTE